MANLRKFFAFSSPTQVVLRSAILLCRRQHICVTVCTDILYNNRYDGGVIVERSIELGDPVIYVSINYRSASTSHFDAELGHNPDLSRLTGFGFLASKEVKAAGVGNLGLQDRSYLRAQNGLSMC